MVVLLLSMQYREKKKYLIYCLVEQGITNVENVVMIMASRCTQCNIDLIERKNYKLMVSVSNPVQVPVTATFFECPSCGLRLYDAEEGIRISELIDSAMKEKDNVVKAPVGSKVIIVDK